MGSYLACPRATREVLDAFGLATKHRLGQNFLVNEHVIDRIMELAQVGRSDVVFEVGPGIGTLTVALLEQAAAVVSVEADEQLVPVLAHTCGQEPHFALVVGDALKVTPERLSAALADVVHEPAEPAPTMLVSNLPYQIAATLVLKVFQELLSVQRQVGMVQKEVADRMMAAPGTKTYGAYTVKLWLYAEAAGRFEVGASNFMPPPHVDSAVVRFDRVARAGADGQPLTPAQLASVSRVVDAAFSQRRKTIRNAMSAQGFDKVALDSAFAAVSIDPKVRAETLAPERFVELAEALMWPA